MRVLGSVPRWALRLSSAASSHGPISRAALVSLICWRAGGQEPSFWAVHPELGGFKPTVAPRGPGGNTMQSLVLAEA